MAPHAKVAGTTDAAALSSQTFNPGELPVGSAGVLDGTIGVGPKDLLLFMGTGVEQSERCGGDE